MESGLGWQMDHIQPSMRNTEVEELAQELGSQGQERGQM